MLTQYSHAKKGGVCAFTYPTRIRVSILLNQDSLVQAAGAKSFLLHSQLNKSNFAKAVMANRYRTAQALKM
jgi:hypothetical protein